MGGGYGDGAYGDMPYGDVALSSSVTTLFIVFALAIAENVVMVQFNLPVYYSGLLDAGDASVPAHYTITPVVGTIGLDGTPVQPVFVASVAQDTDDPTTLFLTTDRPMTAFPALYTLSATGLISADMMSALDPTITFTFFGLFKEIVIPTVELPSPNKDIANPQSLVRTLANPYAPNQLGVFVLDDTGDFTTDSGLLSLKKRVWRRVMSKKGGFFHLGLSYGVGAPQMIKKLGVASRLQQLAADCEAQINQEPDVKKCSVQVVLDQLQAGLVRLNISIQTTAGQNTTFAFGLQKS